MYYLFLRNRAFKNFFFSIKKDKNIRKSFFKKENDEFFNRINHIKFIQNLDLLY